MRALCLLLLVALPGLASAQVRVAMGEEVVFTLEHGVMTRTPAGPPTALETQFGQQTARGEHNDAMGATGKELPAPPGTPQPPVPVADRVRVRFTPVAGSKDALLVIENGYRRALVYRARIGGSGRTIATDVCLVMPDKVGFEFWPYPLDWIEMYDFRLVDWRPGDAILCQ